MSAARSVAFGVAMYLVMGVMGVAGLPVAIASRRLTHEWMRLYCATVFGLLRVIAGIRTEVRGPVPEGAVVLAAKHQSMLDVLILFHALPRAAFVVKRALLYMPVFGLYTWRVGGVFIDRGAGGQAQRVLSGMAGQHGVEGQIVIYPQGTRVAPGDAHPYRKGAAMIARELGLPIVTAATNAGHFWRRGGALDGPGVAVVEFLGPVIPAEDDRATTALIETVVEEGTARLAAET